jgi:EAL domain-containing protein (putative c-di-GMP-specific phosphodiesterase class I)
VIDSVGSLAMPGGVQGGAIAGATCFESGNDANELMLRAEHSLKEAPNRPANWCTWEMLEDRSQPGATQEAHWTEILEEALEQRAVVLHFQPVLSNPDESLLHRETLARVKTSDGALLPAGMFLPIASLVGLGTRIDRLVTELLLEHISASADTACRFAMNLSGHALNDVQFVDWLTTTLVRSGLASRVCVEVREATAIEHTQACIELAEALRVSGAGFGVDHCGGHNAGLEYVRQIKPDYMKIDGTFIKRLGSDPIQREYVRSLVTAAHGMDCLAIAEQLETQGDYEQIRALGFDGAQGHHLGYPQAEYQVGS